MLECSEVHPYFRWGFYISERGRMWRRPGEAYCVVFRKRGNRRADQSKRRCTAFGTFTLERYLVWKFVRMRWRKLADVSSRAAPAFVKGVAALLQRMIELRNTVNQMVNAVIPR